MNIFSSVEFLFSSVIYSDINKCCMMTFITKRILVNKNTVIIISDADRRRSEERRVGKECHAVGRSGGGAGH